MWDSFVDWSTSAYSAVTSYASDTWSSYSSTASSAYDTASSWVSNTWDSYSSSVSSAYDTASSWVSNTWDNYSVQNSYACGLVGDGAAVGACVDTSGTFYGLAGFGYTSASAGTVVNGSVSDYLTGWSGGASNVLGAGVTPSGTTALTLSTPGWDASLTYGWDLNQLSSSAYNYMNDSFNSWVAPIYNYYTPDPSWGY